MIEFLHDLLLSRPRPGNRMIKQTALSTIRPFLLILIAASIPVPYSLAFSNDETDFTGRIELPEIARFKELPRRMYLEPNITVPPPIHYVRDSWVELFQRIVDTGPDTEIRIEAAQALEKVHALDFFRVDGTSLHESLMDSQDDLFQQACVSALSVIGNPEFADDVAALCVRKHEPLCLKVEPNFVEWGGDALRSTWHDRIAHPDDYSYPLMRLACNGLAQLQDTSAIPALEAFLRAPKTEYSIRHDSALAIGVLDAAHAESLALPYMSGPVHERLLAAALLEHSQTDTGLALLEKLCDDPAAAVASRGWHLLQILNPESLVERLRAGAEHQDANVRFSAIRVMHQFPDVPRCEMLHALAGDLHIGVRNSARRVLRQLAEEHSELRDSILQAAGGSVMDESTTWQQLEQSLLLLGELGHRQWQNECVRLLSHPRAEVYTTAAWLLHLMPQHDMAVTIGEITTERYRMLSTVHEADFQSEGLDAQVIFLFQHAGFTKLSWLQPLCEEQFSMSAPCSPEARAAGLWALGRINEGNPDPGLVAKLIERIFFDAGSPPEYWVVRRMCVLSLVAMDARSTIPDLHRVRAMYGTHELLGQTARWAIPQLGGEEIPEIESLRVPFEEFAIYPRE